MNSPGISHIQRAESVHLLDLLQGQVWHDANGGLGPDNPKSCPWLHIDPKSTELMSLVTFSDGKPIMWQDGGARAQPMWWLDAMMCIQSAISEHYTRTKDAGGT